MLLSYPTTYSLLITICALLKQNHDQMISSSVRGFPGHDFFRQIRQRPSAPLLALLNRRLRHFNPDRITQRITLAEQLIRLTPSLQRPGREAPAHTHWVFPIRCDRPAELMRYLWGKGFDATQGGSSLYVVAPPVDRPELAPVEAQQAFQELLYLPVYAGLSSQNIERLAAALNEYDRTHHC